MPIEATFGIRLLASVVILVPAICGLAIQVLLGYTLFSGWKTYRENSFYLITVQLMWCDICALVLDLYAAFPITLTGVQYMGDSSALYYVPLAFEGIAFNGIFMLSLLLTFNRFVLFIFPDLHYKIFTIRGTKIVSLFVWVYVFLLIILSNIFGCRKQFSKEYLYYWYNCSNYDGKHFHYKDFFNIHSYVIPCLMVVMYSIIFVKLKLIRYGSNVTSHMSIKQQIKYIVQTLLICTLIIVEVVGFLAMPFLKLDNYGRFYLTMLLNLIIITNNMITPIIIFAFNREIRQQFKLVFYSHSTTTYPKSIAVVSSRIFYHSRKFTL